MLKNYFKIAFRNLKKDKGFSAINIFGLALGLATCLLISLFVIDELSYDKFNEKADRIYRINADIHINGNSFNSVSTPFAMGIALAKDFPGIEKVVRFTQAGDMLVKKGTETIMDHRSVFADSSFFDVFSIPLIAGNPKTALVAPNTMVISEAAARRYFNSTDVIGKSLLTSNTTNYKITGVFKEMPARSHFHFDFIKAMAELTYSREENWLSNNASTYVLVKPGVSRQQLAGYVNATVNRYIAPQVVSLLHSSFEDMAKNGNYLRYEVLPVLDIHLHSNKPDELEAGGNVQYVTIFIIIAVFILLIACVNFMNLSTARSAGRAKEVGVRKVMGSLRSNLISQFLAESVLTSLIALVFAVLIAWLLLPYFNELSGKKISLNFFSEPWLSAALLLSALVVGLLAGSYPAFYLSAFEPIDVLKGKLSTGFKSGSLRNVLVVFQFATAVLLIIGTLVIYRQLNYIRNKDLGYNREQVMVLQNTYSLWIHAKDFEQQVLKLPGVVSGTMTRNLPNSGDYNINGHFRDAELRANDAILLGTWDVDADFVNTLGMKIVRGRNFSPLMPTDSNCVLINETAATLLGYPDPINKMIYRMGDSNRAVPRTVIGVVKDFHSGSLHDKIGPMIFNLAEERGAMAFRVNTKNIPALISRIESIYHSEDKMAGQPFLYTFMDDDFNRLYQADQRTGKIFISFAVFAILIACLGLFGLVTYAAEQRTREIGIRKVLGAGISQIVQLLSRDFLKLVIIAVIIAFPIAWWGMHKWLENFVYRTNIGWWVFAAAGALALLITMVTVSFRAIRSAMANPSASLRSE